MERYDKIEYDFQNEYKPANEADITTTDKEGFITSQQYIAAEPENEALSVGASENGAQFDESKESRSPREAVLIFQLAVCIIIAAAAFLIKSFGGELYENIREMYYVNLNNSVIVDIDNSNNADFVENIKNEFKDKKS